MQNAAEYVTADLGLSPCRRGGAAGEWSAYLLLAAWVVYLGVTFRHLYRADLVSLLVAAYAFSGVWLAALVVARAVDAERPNYAACRAAGASSSAAGFGPWPLPDPLLTSLAAFALAWEVLALRYMRERGGATAAALAALLAAFAAALLYHRYLSWAQLAGSLAFAAAAAAVLLVLVTRLVVPWSRSGAGGDWTWLPAWLRPAPAAWLDAAPAARAQPSRAARQLLRTLTDLAVLEPAPPNEDPP